MPNLVMIHKSQLEKIPPESGKLFQKEDFVVKVFIFLGQFSP